MIQLNLLPDVKLEYIKARRLKRTVLFLSAITSVAAFALLILMLLVVMVFQKQHLNNLDKDISSSKRKLQSIEDLDRILTVQNQLNSLTTLHDKKPVNSRLFTYMEQITPGNTSVSSLSIDMATQTMTLSGKADALSTINKFVDTLKFTGYQVGDDTKTQKAAFSNVVLQGFSLSEKAGATFNINLKFDPLLFDAKTDARLVIPPNKITTRSEIDKPDALFQTSGGQ